MFDPHGDRAFPGNEPGMFLRDYFAAKAMQAILGKALRYDGEGQPGLEECGKQAVEDTVIAAYQIADAMLEQRLLPQSHRMEEK